SDAAYGALRQFEHLDPGTASVSLSEGNRAAVRSLALAGTLLSQELVSAEHLRLGYGGAYEIASLTSEGIKKLSPVTYVFWSARIVSENEARCQVTPFHVCALGYTNDVLTIRSASIRQDDDL